MFKALKKPIYRGYNIYNSITKTGGGFLVSCWGVPEETHRYMFQTIIFGINLQFPANVIVCVFHKWYLCRELLTPSDPTGKGQKEQSSTQTSLVVEGYVRFEMKVNVLGDFGMFFCLVVSTHLKNISQIGNLPQIGMKVKKIGTTT